MKATKGGDYKPSPQPAPATTFARCYSVVDFGTSEQIFNGESKGKERRIYVTLEMPEFKYVFNEEKGEQPYVIGREMKLSTHENSNLAWFVKSMRGTPFTPQEQEGFDPMKFLSKPCLVTFNVEVKKKYAGQQIPQFTTENSVLKIVSMSPVPQGLQEFPAVNEILAFDFDPQMRSGQFDHDAFSKLPKWMKEKIEKSDEFLHFISLGQVTVGQQYDEPQTSTPAPVQQQVIQQQPQQAPVQQPPIGNTNAAKGW